MASAQPSSAQPSSTTPCQDGLSPPPAAAAVTAPLRTSHPRQLCAGRQLMGELISAGQVDFISILHCPPGCLFEDKIAR